MGAPRDSRFQLTNHIFRTIMNLLNSPVRTACKTLALTLLAVAMASVATAALQPVVDGFGDLGKNSLGIDRMFLSDTVAGGQTTLVHKVGEGVLAAKGEIVPARGQPGWASVVLLLDPMGLPQDASAFKGVRLVVRMTKGNLSVSANSADVTNFDYHAAPVSVRFDGEFHEVRIPFAQMKRTWSEQTKLNPANLVSISLVAFDIQKGAFDFEVDEVGFY